MQVQGALLNDTERHAVSEYASGSRFGAAAYGSPATEKPNSCKSPGSMKALEAEPSWNGWGNGLANTRFQPQKTGGLTAADLPKLKLNGLSATPKR